MSPLRRSAKFAAVVVGTLCLVGTPTAPQQGGTVDELKCESATGKALSKYVGARAKCTTKCFVRQRKTSGPYGG